MSSRILMAPSILSADFSRLGDAVGAVEAAGADYIHVDVMDGHFVPNLTIGPPVIKALKQVTSVPLDVHLMIDNVDTTIDWYLEAGADVITVHAEACTHLHRVLRSIREAGASPGVSLNPGTPIGLIGDVLGELDMVLVMSVNPGFGGQSFILNSVRKIAELAEFCDAEGVSPLIQVDGGITADTIGPCVDAGARCFVAGNAVFATPDPGAALNAIRSAGEKALG
ncbi:MAG: ribulose-phosphate 3-epimerase [Coriobacteriia bacterium]|nr:ribulose-phosphate 3-epimerase [Coriobacteriia bacterium]